MRALWMRYRWPILAVAAVVGLVLGFFGFRTYAEEHWEHHSTLDVIFADLSIFSPDQHYEPPFPWELEVARFMLPLILLVSVISGLFVLFRDRFEQARLPFLRGHAIVAGAGAKGLAFVKALRAGGRTVVVIESEADNKNLASATEVGAIVVVGDATDRDVLALAGVRKARHLLATASDATNAEIAIQARSLKHDDGGITLECLAHVVDPELCTLLKRETLMGDGSNGFRLDFFNFYDHAARRACAATLRPGDRVVTIGEGPVTDQIVLRAGAELTDAADPLDITVTGEHAAARVAALIAAHPHLATAARVHPVEVAPTVAALRAVGVLDADAAPATVFVADLDDTTALEIALGLRASAQAGGSQVVVCTNQADGLARVLSSAGAGSAFDPVVVLALAREACTTELVERGIYELLGRAIHENYCRERRAEGSLPADDPSLQPWADLAESLRASNRSQAEHIGAKLRTVGCDLVPSDGSADPTFTFTDVEVERLGQMEHDRWMDERLRAGWHLGKERDPVARTSPYLVGWDQLTEDIRDRDRETARALPRVVSTAGFQVVRLEPARA